MTYSYRELSGKAIAALQEFYCERRQRAQRFEELKTVAEQNDADVKWSMEMFTEDWNASQFWVSYLAPTAWSFLF